MKKKSSTEKMFDITHAVSALCAVALITVVTLQSISPFMALFAVVFLGISVSMAVHYAEVIAARVGPSLGALILALSVTIIEVGLIVSLMMNNTPDSPFIARDTVFSAVIIVTNGIVGFGLWLGGLKFKELGFNPGGANSLLAVLVVLSGLTMVLPNVTTTTGVGTYSTAQLILVSVACLLLYFALIFSQTITHKEYFEPLAAKDQKALSHHIPTIQQAWVSFGGLILTLVVVIGLAKSLSPSIEAGIHAIGAPRATVGIVVALLVLMPEAWSAIGAARANQLQTSLNLALGSGAASIALTIPVVSAFSIITDRELVLGLDNKGVVFLLTTFLTCGLTLNGGRGTALMGAVHLILMFAFVALNFIP